MQRHQNTSSKLCLLLSILDWPFHKKNHVDTVKFCKSYQTQEESAIDTAVICNENDGGGNKDGCSLYDGII